MLNAEPQSQKRVTRSQAQVKRSAAPPVTAAAPAAAAASEKRSSGSGAGWAAVSRILFSSALAVPLMLAYFSAATQAHFSRLLAIDEKSLTATDPTQRLLFALRWLSPVCILVTVCIQAVAFSRFFSPARDGKTPNWLTDLLRSILQNTLEQAFLLTLNLLALSQNIRPEQLVLIPMLVGLFLIARLAFAVGYILEPTKRALGFVLTFAPNVVVGGYNVYCLILVA